MRETSGTINFIQNSSELKLYTLGNCAPKTVKLFTNLTYTFKWLVFVVVFISPSWVFPSRLNRLVNKTINISPCTMFNFIKEWKNGAKKWDSNTDRTRQLSRKEVFRKYSKTPSTANRLEECLFHGGTTSAGIIRQLSSTQCKSADLVMDLVVSFPWRARCNLWST